MRLCKHECNGFYDITTGEHLNGTKPLTFCRNNSNQQASQSESVLEEINVFRQFGLLG